MSMRITPQMISGSTLRDINASFEALRRSSEEISSGRSILEPSDNPYGAGRAVALQSAIAGLTGYQGNVQEAISWENTATSALNSIGSVVQRVRQLVIEAGNGVNNASDLENMAGEVEQLTESVKQDANVQFAGRYVLSGTATATAPYEAGLEDEYKGNEGAIERAIGPGSPAQLTVQINQAAVTLLGNGPESKDGKLLAVLRGIAKNMREGTPAALTALRNTDLEGIEASSEALTQMQAHTGAVLDQLRTAESRIEGLKASSAQMLSSTQDANIAEVSIEYSTQQAGYQAALRAGASIVQMSLLEFLK